MNPFLLDSYDFELPESLIAQEPRFPRDSSRLMVIDRKKRTIVHQKFSDLPQWLGSGDLCVANNTRVIRARLLGRRLVQKADQSWEPGGAVECVLLEQKDEAVFPYRWECLFKASVRTAPGVRFEIPAPDGKNLVGTLVSGASESQHGTIVVDFNRDPVGSGAGELPLPHYIKRSDAVSSLRAQDEESYQTVFASNPGSAAAPTAGLHFTPELLQELKTKGVEWSEVTLNVGLGTFRPVKVNDIREHAMHEEKFFISSESAQQIMTAKQSGKKVLAVGTTSVRTLESAFDPSTGQLNSGTGRTSIFLYPGGRSFQVVDRLITNFHLPKSTLLMLVCAFADRDLILEAYRTAVREKYRFFSYGDAMLIL